METYTVVNRVKGQARVVEAASALEACDKARWPFNDCFTKTRSLEIRKWEIALRDVLTEAEKLHRFCRERFQYSQYEDGLENLIRNLELDVITAAHS